MSARLQGSAADIIGRAMIHTGDAVAGHKLAAHMLLQVHDELVFEVPDAEVGKTLPLVKKVMKDAPQQAAPVSAPLQVEAHAANNWREAH
jgi:DNA polymerase I